jgi:hypothetical protein
MDSSFHEEESAAQRTAKRSFISIRASLNIIEWLKGLISLTEQEQQDAGIYLDRLANE